MIQWRQVVYCRKCKGYIPNPRGSQFESGIHEKLPTEDWDRLTVAPCPLCGCKVKTGFRIRGDKRLVDVWDMTDEQLEQEAKKQRHNGETEHADKLMGFRDERREHCPICKRTWQQLHLNGINAYSSHIKRCAQPNGEQSTLRAFP